MKKLISAVAIAAALASGAAMAGGTATSSSGATSGNVTAVVGSGFTAQGTVNGTTGTAGASNTIGLFGTQVSSNAGTTNFGASGGVTFGSAFGATGGLAGSVAGATVTNSFPF
jgi:hypothetical protein